MSGAADFFRKLQKSIPQLERDLAQIVVAVEAEKFHAENFRNQGFTDQTFQPWPKRKKAESPERALLVKTGTLKGHALKGRPSGKHVDFVFPLDYMKVHNEGGQAGRGNGFKMPKRQFVGDSAKLRQMITDAAQRFINKRLNNL